MVTRSNEIRVVKSFVPFQSHVSTRNYKHLRIAKVQDTIINAELSIQVKLFAKQRTGQVKTDGFVQTKMLFNSKK